MQSCCTSRSAALGYCVQTELRQKLVKVEKYMPNHQLRRETAGCQNSLSILTLGVDMFCNGLNPLFLRSSGSFREIGRRRCGV